MPNKMICEYRYGYQDIGLIINMENGHSEEASFTATMKMNIAAQEIKWLSDNAANCQPLSTSM